MKINIEVQHLCSENLRGIPYYILNLVDALVKRNNNEYAVSFYDYNSERGNYKYIEKYLSQDTIKKIDVHECNEISYKDVMASNITGDRTIYNGKTFAEHMKIDADIEHYTQSLNLPFNIEGKAIVTVHDVIPLLPNASEYCFEESIKAFKNVIRYIEDNENIEVIADSMSTKYDIIKYTKIQETRIHVVPLAYNEELHFHEKNDEILHIWNLENENYILYLGVMDSRKGIIEVLEAFSLLKERFADLKLVLAGKMHKIPFKRGVALEDIVNEHKYLSDIVITGFVSDKEKRALISSTKVFLCPSKYEGFGLPVLEAMACGAPVVTTNISSLPEVGGDAALYVTPGDSSELASVVSELLNSEELRQSCIKKGLEQCKNFSWNKTAELTEKVYLEVANK